MTAFEILTSKSSVIIGKAGTVMLGIDCSSISNGVSDGIDIIPMNIEEVEIVNLNFSDREEIALNIREIELVDLDMEL